VNPYVNPYVLVYNSSCRGDMRNVLGEFSRVQCSRRDTLVRL